MGIDPRILYWTRGEAVCNFGDFLSDFFCRTALLTPVYEADAYRLIGSAIAPALIENDLRNIRSDDALIAYWCCGMREATSIKSHLKKHCKFFGVRGPLTRDALELGLDTPFGDPAFLLPLIYAPKPSPRTAGKAICIPHFSEMGKFKDATLMGADLLILPSVSQNSDLTDLFDDIVSADFVLTGSLHGAIVACAYGVPFAYWDSGFIDIPFKWDDFSASIGIEAVFVKTVDEGRRFYESVRNRIKIPELSPILGCCPFAVRPTLMLGAIANDTGVEQSTRAAMLRKADNMWSDQPQFISFIQNRQAKISSDDARSNITNKQTINSRVARHLDVLNSKIKSLAVECDRQIEVLTTNINSSAPEIKYNKDSVGALFLDGGWTSPNDVAPWSLPPVANIRIPSGLGWERAHALSIHGYLFAPLKSPFNGERSVRIWVNSVEVWHAVFRNQNTSHSDSATFRFALPEQIMTSGNDLVISIALQDVGSAADLGLGDDDRPIGFAPIVSVFEFS